MTRRSGATLMEVLVAIFVTAIGLLGLLALFPVGTVSMNQAIKNNRSALAAVNATGIAAVLPATAPPATVGLRKDPTVTPWLMQTPPSPPYPSPPYATPPYPPIPAPGQPSYPVYIDSVGVSLVGSSTVSPTGVGAGTLPSGIGTPGIPRLQASFATTSAAVDQWLTLLDDMIFLPNGLTTGASQPVVQRHDRYSWCYLLQALDASTISSTNPAGSGVNLTVVVYSGRSPAILGENVYYVDYNQNTNAVVIPYNPAIGQARPNVRPGRWVLDATVILPPVPPATQPTPNPHGDFYRVVSVTDTTYTTAAGAVLPAVQCEVHIPIKDLTSAGQQQGVLVVMDGVVEVFLKGP